MSLTLIPPSPLTEQVTLEVRGAARNHSAVPAVIEVAFHLDEEHPEQPLHRQAVEVPPHSARGVSFRWSAWGKSGTHRMILVSRCGGRVDRTERVFEVLASPTRSSKRIGGAWIMFEVTENAGGAPFLEACRRLTDAQWVEMVQGMHALGMNVVVIENVFHSPCYYGLHQIERDGYPGLAYYPSRLFPGRARITAVNPVEAILGEADRLGMHVFLGVGVYAWFDYTPGSLAWHKLVASELYEDFSGHPSFYGWYVSEETTGSLGSSPAEKKQAVEFFRQFQAHCRQLAPDKPVLLATGVGCVSWAIPAWRECLPYCDILAPFGVNRTPVYDIPPDQSVRLWQSLCDEAGTHLWLDQEAFLFGPHLGLIPRPIDAIVEELERYATFEKVLCFQYPALFSAPWASSHPGGAASVTLYENYQKYLTYGRDYWRQVPPESMRQRLPHAAVGKPVRYVSVPVSFYRGGGTEGLTDGFLGRREQPYFEENYWQGYQGLSVDAIVDLGQPMPLAVISSDYLQQIEAGVYLPPRLEYAVGNHPDHFLTVAVLDPGLCTEPGPFARAFPAKLKGVTGRYVRVRAANVQTIPAGQPGAGRPAWLFIDEIIVEAAAAIHESQPEFRVY